MCTSSSPTSLLNRKRKEEKGNEKKKKSREKLSDEIRAAKIGFETCSQLQTKN